MKKKLLIVFYHAMLMGLCVTAQPAQPPKPPSNEEKLKHVSEKISKEITLTAAQKVKVETAYKEFFIDMDKLREKNGKKELPPPPPPGSKEEVDKLSKERDAKIKAALSEVQYKKYMNIESSLHPPRPGEQPGKQPPPPSGKPE